MASVAVVGLGGMGSRMARRFFDAGHELVVWNRDAAKTRPFAELGARVAPTPARAAHEAEAVITMVADPSALEAVTEGPDGIVAGATEDTTLVQMATVRPASVLRLETLLPSGADLLDAPVLGSLSEAESGSLKIFAGGPSPLVERWSPLLSALGSVLHVGPIGAGTAAKLVANSTLFGVLGVLGEALALARGMGLDGDAAFDVLALTPVAAQAERRRPAFESGDYPTRFRLALALKDADLVLEAAAGSEVDLRVAPAARSWLAEASAAGLGDADYSAVLARIAGSG